MFEGGTSRGSNTWFCIELAHRQQAQQGPPVDHIVDLMLVHSDGGTVQPALHVGSDWLMHTLHERAYIAYLLSCNFAVLSLMNQHAQRTGLLRYLKPHAMIPRACHFDTDYWGCKNAAI